MSTPPPPPPPPPFYWRGAGLSLQPDFQKGDLTRSQFLEGGCLEKRGQFFSGGWNFHIKNKLKPETFNDKKRL